MFTFQPLAAAVGKDFALWAQGDDAFRRQGRTTDGVTCNAAHRLERRAGKSITMRACRFRSSGGEMVWLKRE